MIYGLSSEKLKLSMESVHIHFFHGWAQDSSIFEPIIESLQKSNPQLFFSSYDQEYFSDIPTSSSKANSSVHFIVAYSFGWAHIPKSLLKKATKLLLIDPFFLSNNDKQKKLEYKTLLRRFKNYPLETLKQFFSSAKIEPLDFCSSTVNFERLEKDLAQIQTLKPSFPNHLSVDIIAHKGDPISSYQAVEELVGNSQNISLYDSHQALHGLNKIKENLIIDTVKKSIEELKQKASYNPFTSPLAYSQNSRIQEQSAELLTKALFDLDFKNYPSILEFGVGTGYLTQRLLDRFKIDDYTINDINKQMLHQTESLSSNLKTIQGLIEEIELIQAYDLITSNFSLQWTNPWKATLDKLASHLKTDGLLALALPNQSSFPEWQEQCQQNNVPYTGALSIAHQDLINWAQSSHLQIIQQSELALTTSHPSAIDFFRSLKQIGASSSAHRPNLSSFRKLIDNWIERPIQTTYNISLLIARKTT